MTKNIFLYQLISRFNQILNFENFTSTKLGPNKPSDEMELAFIFVQNLKHFFSILYPFDFQILKF